MIALLAALILGGPTCDGPLNDDLTVCMSAPVEVPHCPPWVACGAPIGPPEEQP